MASGRSVDPHQNVMDPEHCYLGIPGTTLLVQRAMMRIPSGIWCFVTHWIQDKAVFWSQNQIRWINYFVASRIRIHNYLYGSGSVGILPSTSKNIEKPHDWNCFVTFFLPLSKKIDLNVPTVPVSNGIKKNTLWWWTFLQCGGSRMFIPDPTFFRPGSRIQKEITYFNPKKIKKMVSKL